MSGVIAPFFISNDYFNCPGATSSVELGDSTSDTFCGRQFVWLTRKGRPPSAAVTH